MEAPKPPPFLALVGTGALFAYAVVETLQPEDRYGRLFAAYAGVFLIGALLWDWASTATSPTARTGSAAVLLTGVVIVLFGRAILA